MPSLNNNTTHVILRSLKEIDNIDTDILINDLSDWTQLNEASNWSYAGTWPVFTTGSIICGAALIFVLLVLLKQCKSVAVGNNNFIVVCNPENSVVSAYPVF